MGMKSRTRILVAACWIIALLAFIRTYLATTKKPEALSSPPVVINPKQPNVPAHVRTAAEKELEEKQIDQLRASLAKAVKDGNIPTPYPPISGRDATGEPLPQK